MRPSAAILALVILAATVAMVTCAKADPTGSSVGGTAGNQSYQAGCLYQISPSTLTNGQQAGLRCNSAGALNISGNITASNASVGLTGSTVPSSGNYIAGSKSGTLTGLTLDGSSNLNINCVVGCAGGAFNNNSDGVATSSGNGQTAAWLYGFNGTTFDRIREDGSGDMFVSLAGTNYLFSTGNSTTTQLGAGATFTGTIDNVTPHQAISELITTDQPGTLTITQYIDAGGSHVVGTKTVSVAAGVGQGFSFTINGNYLKVTFQNTGGSSTTTLDISTAYGIIPPTTNLLNTPVALNEVNGTALSLGSTTSSASIPVVIASDQAAVNVSIAQVGATTVVTGGVNGSLGVGGVTASGASVTGNPVQTGGRAQNAEATAVTNGQAVEAAYDLVGKAIVMPFANKENFIQGYASTTGGSATTIIASCGASTKCYITGVQCYNTSATTITVTLTDSASTVLIVPAGGGNNASFETPLATAAATAFQFTASTGETTIGCAAQGYKGT